MPHFEKRSNNSWTFRIELPHDAVTGKRKQRTVTVKGTRKDAERKYAEMLNSVSTGSYVQPSKTTLGDYLRQWLRDYASSGVRQKTYERYVGIIEKQLIPNLGAIPLSQLQPNHIRSYYAQSLKDGRLDGRPGGLSPQTVIHHHRVLSEALGHAVKWGILPRNVAQAVDPPRIQKREMTALDEEAVHQFLAAAEGTVYYPLFHLDIYTGMRRSELLGLRWKDVDLGMATLSIVQVLHRLNDGRIVFEEPKTGKSRRLIPLPPQAVVALREHHDDQERIRATMSTDLTETHLVFSKPDDTLLLPDTVSHAFRDIARRAGLPGVRLHDLRHTHATLLLKQGTHPKVVQERLGHSNISITLDTYSHVLPGIQEAAALRFGEELERTRPVAKDDPSRKPM